VASLASRIHSRLAADTALSAIATGKVWKRRLVRSGENATAEAFRSTPPYPILPCVVVIDEGEDADPSGGPRSAFMGFPVLWLYAYDDPNGTGRETVSAMWRSCYGLLSGWQTGTDDGTQAVVQVIGRLGAQDRDPAFPEAIMDTMRLSIDGLWRAVS
jgi:hypothetical protein